MALINSTKAWSRMTNCPTLSVNIDVDALVAISFRLLLCLLQDFYAENKVSGVPMFGLESTTELLERSLVSHPQMVKRDSPHQQHSRRKLYSQLLEIGPFLSSWKSLHQYLSNATIPHSLPPDMFSFHVKCKQDGEGWIWPPRSSLQ